MGLNDIGQTIWTSKYAAYRGESYEEGCLRVVNLTNGYLDSEKQHKVYTSLSNKLFSPGGRIWYAAGKPKQYMQNCALFGVSDSAESWMDTLHDVGLSLTKGLGVGVDYSEIRPKGSYVAGLGGTASGSLSLMHMVNEVARYIVQGGARRSACYGSLHWKHGEIFNFIKAKNWNEDQIKAKEKDILAVADLDIHNISVRLDTKFINAYTDETHTDHKHAVTVWDTLMLNMFKTGDPGIQFDADDNIYRNGCTEIISNTHGDSCTLASINLANIDTDKDLFDAIEGAVIIALIARYTSLYPTEHMREVARNNMRLGVGFFGLHNYLLKRGLSYGWCSELKDLLSMFSYISRYFADKYTKQFGFNRPIAVNAIAPTGSISTLNGGVSGGCEPIFSAAYLRRMYVGMERQESIVIDPYVLSLVEQGKINPSEPFADALSLATPEGFKRRVDMQVNIQRYTDNAISSTINLPAWGTGGNNEQTLDYYKQVIFDALPKLRGITVYPDGARGGQPLTSIPLVEALRHKGYTLDTSYSNCSSGLCAT